MKFDVVALGELLIDVTIARDSGTGLPKLHGDTGGAPANVLATVGKLGGRTAFIGKVGNDPFGDIAVDALQKLGVDTGGLIQSDHALTTLAIVTVTEDGERSFRFHRNPGADTQLSKDEVSVEVLQNTKIFHFGSLSLTEDPVRTATLYAVQVARESGAFVSYDPNLRLSLWNSDEDARTGMGLGLREADLVKVSEEELSFLTRCGTVEEGVRMLKEMYDIPVLVVTLGAKGTCLAYGRGLHFVETIQIHPVDSTGAGDAFLGGLLYQLLVHDMTSLTSLTEAKLVKCVQFANVVGALTTEKQGTFSALPELSQVQPYM